MSLLFSNNATGTLSITLTVGATSAVLNAGEGQNFPSPSGGDTFRATLEDAAGNIEVVSCTSRSSDTLTIVRGQEGTTPAEFAAGSRLELRLTAGVLNSLNQTVDANELYAPKTHFNDNSTAAEQLHNAERATITNAQGIVVQRASAQTETILSLRDSAGVEGGTLQADSTSNLDLYNKRTSGNVRARSTNSEGTATTIWTGDPDNRFSAYNSGAIKLQTEAYGIRIRSTNNLPPYAGSYRLYTADGNTELGAIGFISSTNEFRINSYANGFPIGLHAHNNGGTLVRVVTGDPDGAAQMFYADAKKIETTSTGVTITGVVSQSTAPTANSHLTTKSYVDTAVATATPSAYSASNAGRRTEADGFTQQWGTSGAVSGGGNNKSVNVTFPVEFSNVWNVQVTPIGINLAGGEDTFTVSGVDTTGFTITCRDMGTPTFYWFAVGRII